MVANHDGLRRIANRLDHDNNAYDGSWFKKLYV